MDIGSFARDKFIRERERDPGKAAQAYVAEALNADDPSAALIAPVRHAFTEEFRRLRKGLRDELGQLDQPPAVPEGMREQFRRTLSQRRAQLLTEEVWTRTRGSIPWAEVTAHDIMQTISHYQHEVAGITRHITQLESAHRLLMRFEVDHLGEIPPEEWENIVMGGSEPIRLRYPGKLRSLMYSSPHRERMPTAARGCIISITTAKILTCRAQ